MLHVLTNAAKGTVPFLLGQKLGQSPWVERTGWVLVHSLWQFALVALLAAMLQWALRRRSAAMRYGVLLAAMSFLVVLPAVTWLVIGAADKPVADRSAPVENEIVVVSPPHSASGETPLLLPKMPDALSDEHAKPQAAPIPHEAQPRESLAWWSNVKARVQPWLPAIVLVWFTGVAAFASRPLLSWYTVRRLRRVGVSPVADAVRTVLDRTAKRLRLTRAVAVLQSTLVRTPVVIGCFRPLVLLPLCVVTGLPESQLELILAHELAHIRRHDYLVNLLQTLIETLFFYHPAVWWLSRRIRNERENCCDDIAMSLAGSRADYGRALLAIEELCVASPYLAVAAGGGSLLARIRRIAGREAAPRPVSGGIVGILLVSITVLALVAWHGLTAAETKTGKGPDKSPAAKTDAADEPSKSESPLDSILKRLAEEEKRYDPLDVTATASYQHLNKAETVKGITMRRETHEHSIVAGNRLYHEETDESLDGEGKKTSILSRQAYDGLWTRADNELTESQSERHVSASIILGQADAFLRLLRAHNLLFHYDLIDCPSLATFLASGWYDRHNRYPMTVEYLGDEQAEGLYCHKLKCALPTEGKVDMYILLWLARDRNLLPVRREWYEGRVNVSLPTGVNRVTKFREVRPGQWFPFEATELAYSKDALRKGQVALQWFRDVRIDKVSLASPADERIFSSVEAPEGTSIGVCDRLCKKLGDFKQPRTGKIEISLDRFHAMQRATEANEEDDLEPSDYTEPKRKQRINAAYAVLRADPPLAQKERIEAALTILQEYTPFYTNSKKWTTAIRELIIIGKPALPRLIDELDHIDRAARQETELRALGFVLRGIGDARAVPALIRALPYTLQPPFSDYALGVEDSELLAFMQQHDHAHTRDGTNFSFGRPINEILPALQKLTGVAPIVPTAQGDREIDRVQHIFLGGDANNVRSQRELFLRFARRWADWWAKNWKQYVSDEKDAQLDQIQAVLERIEKQAMAAPGEEKAPEAAPKAPAPKASGSAGKSPAANSPDALGDRWLPAYPLIDFPKVQDQLKLSPAQKEKLVEVSHASATAPTEIDQATAGMPPDRLKMEWARAWQRRERQRRENIESLLTPQQLDTYRNLVFSRMAFRELFVPGMRKLLGVTPEQEKKLAEINRSTFAEKEQRDKQRTARLLALLDAHQRERLRAEVERVHNMDFDPEAPMGMWSIPMPIDRDIPSVPAIPCYSELWTGALNGLVALDAAQKTRRDDIAAKYWQRRHELDLKVRQFSPEERNRREHEFRKMAAPINREARDAIEAMLTTQQLAAVKEIRFQTNAQATLNWFRRDLGLSKEQEAVISQIEQEAANEGERFWQEIADKQLAVFTAEQQQKLRELLDRLGW